MDFFVFITCLIDNKIVGRKFNLTKICLYDLRGAYEYAGIAFW